MKVIVTGCAGFIGNHLTYKLLSKGYNVIGIDSFEDYYSIKIKEKNLENFIKHKNFKLIKKDILKVDLKKVLKDVKYIFHLAAQAGVRASWGNNFDTYIRCNIKATQYLLEALKEYNCNAKIIYSSSSSIYGNQKKLPFREDFLPNPYSPYGVTKLAAEHLVELYHKNYNIDYTILRYFTVYGPNQRPDMGFYKFIKNILQDKEIIVYGDGKQTRDFTFVDDIVKANILSMKNIDSKIFNIGGGKREKLINVVKLIYKLCGKQEKMKYTDKQKGDVSDTYSDISLAKKELKYKPKISLEQGIKKQIIWMKSILEK